jgi:hypothetical protein
MKFMNFFKANAPSPSSTPLPTVNTSPTPLPPNPCFTDEVKIVGGGDLAGHLTTEFHTLF